jgi:membrane-bound metal-dependent hydrolase YbcI (DUF457 family)
MPNAKTHLIIGGLTGAVVNAQLQLDRLSADPNGRFDWGELLLCMAAAGAAALLPDLLEPATTPNHRSFCHSVTAAALVAYAVSGTHTKECSQSEFLLLTMLGLGYLSHLAADATTPRSITLI